MDDTEHAPPQTPPRWMLSRRALYSRCLEVLFSSQKKEENKRMNERKSCVWKARIPARIPVAQCKSPAPRAGRMTSHTSSKSLTGQQASCVKRAENAEAWPDNKPPSLGRRIFTYLQLRVSLSPTPCMTYKISRVQRLKRSPPFKLNQPPKSDRHGPEVSEVNGSQWNSPSMFSCAFPSFMQSNMLERRADFLTIQFYWLPRTAYLASHNYWSHCVWRKRSVFGVEFTLSVPACVHLVPPYIGERCNTFRWFSR